MTDDPSTTSRPNTWDGSGRAFGAPLTDTSTSAGPASTPPPPERVGRGAALALLAIPAGAVPAAIIAALGFVAGLSAFLTAVLAPWLYAKGSGGRVRKGIPVLVVVIALGIVANFVSVVAVELWQAFPTLDPAVAATYASRTAFVTENLFRPSVLAGEVRRLVTLVVLGLVAGVAVIVRLVRQRPRA